MNREQGKGPFVGERVKDDHGPTVLGDHAVIRDSTGAPFCYVATRDCHGGDLSAAKARATRIAESLNKSEGFGS